MSKRESVTRYVITRINSDGNRTMAFAMQGRWTYATAEEAETALEGYRKSLEIVMQYTGLEVRPVPCYPVHFDPMTCWFDLEAA